MVTFRQFLQMPQISCDKNPAGSYTIKLSEGGALKAEIDGFTLNQLQQLIKAINDCINQGCQSTTGS